MKAKCIGKTLKGTSCNNYGVTDQMCKRHYAKYIEEQNRKETITITFSEAVENHKGMEIIGQRSPEGFSCADLQAYKITFEKMGVVCEYCDLTQYLDQSALDVPFEGDAAILILRNVLPAFKIDAQALWKEVWGLDWDEKAFMYGKVVNKNARHNLCFADFDRAPDYEEGKGTIVSFEALPLLSIIREMLQQHLGDKASKLYAEGNLYYDHKKCGIGAHGDTERSKVIALRLGEPIPIQYHWFYRHNKIGRCFNIMLNNGDMYIMSAKAVGNDWKKSSIPTLRHCAGAKEYLFE